jgi:hypothetical protein
MVSRVLLFVGIHLAAIFYLAVPYLLANP